MTKPEDIPQRVWDKAVKLAREYRQWAEAGNTDARLSDHAEAAMADSFARAIMAAEQREREACAQIAADGMSSPGADPWARGYRCASADIYESILNRGENQGD